MKTEIMHDIKGEYKILHHDFKFTITIEENCNIVIKQGKFSLVN